MVTKLMEQKQRQKSILQEKKKIYYMHVQSNNSNITILVKMS